MKGQAVNPYLPSYEYIPDGEPRLFDGRVYVYGSHDRFNAPIFCVNDYVCWSAPADDLSDWRFEGVIYRKNQDPSNPFGLHLLFAPDVVQGTDGKYYLYYAFDFLGMIGVAVSDTPAGQYRFLGHVHYPDGTAFGRRSGDQFPFDPGVLVDDDGSVWLYSGFYTPVPAVMTGFRKLKNDGGTVIGLEPDMVTVRTEPKVIFPVKGEGSFAGHEFFEASSIRKDGDRYIFVYSSRNNHELCWAYSDRPDGGFTFGGTLVDQGDLYLDGNTSETDGVNYLGNTHGGMLILGDERYIFYHRQTNRHSYSRQACAEKLARTEDGGYLQAEVTSCGLNGGPLRGKGRYEARIACCLRSRNGVGRYDCPNPRKAFAEHPYFTQTGKDRNDSPDQYIANMRDGSVAGFRYFRFEGTKRVKLELGGNAEGTVEVFTNDRLYGTPAGSAPVNPGGEKQTVEIPVEIGDSVNPLFFRFTGKGSLDFHAFTLE